MSKISSIVAVSGADPGPRPINANSGDWSAATNTGVGLYDLDTIAGRGFVVGDGNVLIGGMRGTLVGGDLQAVQYRDVDPTGIQKRIETRQEAALALSAAADFDVDFLNTTVLNTENRNARVIGLAKIGAVADGGNPGYVWRTGAFNAALGTPAPGTYVVNLRPGYGGDATQVIMLVQPNLIPTPRLASSAVLHNVDDVTKTITTTLERAGGAAVGPSVLTDMDVNVALIGIGANPELEVGRIHAQLRMTEARALTTFQGASGHWDTANFVDNGAGAYDIPYLAGQGSATGETLYFFGFPNPGVAGLVSASYDDTNPELLRIVNRLEGGGGAESASADMQLDILALTASPQ